jgi:uncharacterized membrane protein YkoI
MLTLAKRLSALAFLAGIAAASSAMSDDGEREDEDDHHQREAVRAAVERGEVKSLLDVLREVKPQLHGEIVGVEIERQGRAWIYEFRVADAKGRLFKVYVDAATAKILKTEEK